MPYEKEYTTLTEHIDFQGIMDGLYYPFYMEDCRHSYLDSVLGYNIEEQAKLGINIVLAEYTIKFKQPLMKDDKFTVTCECNREKVTRTRFQLNQSIIKDGKVTTEGIFTATFVNANSGRPYIPEPLKEKIMNI